MTLGSASDTEDWRWDGNVDLGTLSLSVSGELTTAAAPTVTCFRFGSGSSTPLISHVRETILQVGGVN